MNVLKFKDLPQGGFNGLEERRFVTDSRIFKAQSNRLTFDGMGNFVYLADASYLPFGETKMHPHKEIDVISVMGKGAVNHEGSLKHGKSISNNMAQVQRAGSEGFSHNEINPSANRNQLIQIWVLPDEFGERAGYKTYSFEKGTMTKIYGGAKSQNATFYSKTSIKVGRANKHQEFALEGEVMAYLPRGSAIINGDEIPAKSLVHVDDGLNYEAQEDDALVIFIYVEGR